MRLEWGNAKPGQLLGYDKDGNRCGFDTAPNQLREEALDILIARQQRMHKALLSARETLEIFDHEDVRVWGADVRTALNLVRDAVALCEPPGVGNVS